MLDKQTFDECSWFQLPGEWKAYPLVHHAAPGDPFRVCPHERVLCVLGGGIHVLPRVCRHMVCE